MRLPFTVMVLAAALLPLGGCATTIGIVGPENVMSSSRDRIVPLEGPEEVRLRGVRYSVSDKAFLCETERRGRVRVEHWHAGYDGGARFAIGFIGFAQIALGAIVTGVAIDIEPEPDSLAYAIPAGLLAIDGVIAMGLAMFLDDYEHSESEERMGAWSLEEGCAPGTVLELGGVRVEADASGRLPAPPSAAAWSEAGAVTVRTAESSFSLDVSHDLRCSVARGLGLALSACGGAPPPVRVRPPPPTSGEVRGDFGGEIEIEVEVEVERPPR